MLQASLSPVFKKHTALQNGLLPGKVSILKSGLKKKIEILSGQIPEDLIKRTVYKKTELNRTGEGCILLPSPIRTR